MEPADSSAATVGLSQSDYDALEAYLADRQDSAMQRAADAAADAVLEDVRETTSQLATVQNSGSDVSGDSQGDVSSSSSDAQIGTSESPCYVVLSNDQWEVVRGACRIQDTCSVFCVLLLGLLAGTLLWGQFAASLKR